MQSFKFSRLTSLIKSYDSRMWILFFGWMISAMGFAMVIPYLSIYFHNRMNIPMSQVGLLFGAGAVAQSLFGLWGGDLSDKIGRVKIMGSAQLVRSFIFILMGILAWKGGSFLLWALLLICNWIAGSFYQPVANAMAADIAPKGKRVEAYSILRIGGNVGWAVGPMIGGFLASASYPTLFFFASLATFISSILVLFFLSETVKVDSSEGKFTFKDIKKLKSDHLFLQYCAVGLLLFLVIGQLVATISVFSVDYVGISESKLGFLYATNGLIVILFQLPVAKFTQSRNLIRIICIGSLGYALGYFLVGFATSFLWLFLCFLVISFSEITVLPASMAIVANLSKEKHHGLYMGGYGLFFSLGWSIGPLIGGILIDLLGRQPVILWGIVASLGVLSAWGFNWIGKRLPPDAISPRVL